MYNELVERLRSGSYTLEELSIILPRAAEAIEELMRRCEQFKYMPPPAWIPVTERLPEPNAVDERGFVKAYLVKTDRHVMMHTARWDGMYWILWGTRTTMADKVTHWMSLPTPPKGEKE